MSSCGICEEGKVRFIPGHTGNARGVSFHPKERYLFCSGGYDGKVKLYSAKKGEIKHTIHVSTESLSKNVNGVRFNCDGRRILASTSARRVVVIDVEKGQQVYAYDNCVSNNVDRTCLATDPTNHNIFVSTWLNGKGLTLYDLRMSTPPDHIHEMHRGTIRDVLFIHGSWPWCKGRRAMLTVGDDGIFNVTSIGAENLHQEHVGQEIYSAAPTPEVYGSAASDGFASHIMLGGETIRTFVPEAGIHETLKDSNGVKNWRIKYTSNGSFLFTACEQGIVRKYRRWPDHHEYLGEVFRHKGDVMDLDISPYDEYLVTASSDWMVGVFKLGGPNHGASEYGELT